MRCSVCGEEGHNKRSCKSSLTQSNDNHNNMPASTKHPPKSKQKRKEVVAGTLATERAQPPLHTSHNPTPPPLHNRGFGVYTYPNGFQRQASMLSEIHPRRVAYYTDFEGEQTMSRVHDFPLSQTSSSSVAQSHGRHTISSQALQKIVAQAWYNWLKHGDVNPGAISLGQNLSNLLRIGLLYRFGGIYLDTDFIIVRKFGELKNVIGAQTIDLDTGNWSRLNNVMIFDRGHPLLKFIDEFARTFDGNKWGHNGSYLVSRVVLRLSGDSGYNFTVLPPMAFYPVGWSRIGSLFEGPRSLSHSKWLVAKLRQIRRRSFAVHLWNKQSTHFKVEKGSIVEHLMFR